MSELTRERLYNLLPAVYRVRDVAQGEPLRALLKVIEHELNLLEVNIDQLYDDCFIETCAEWVVPYIGDLLGVRGLVPIQNGTFSQRALVANTLAYRRGKGTVAILEQLARDATGWPAKVVEFFMLLATTQYLNHVRLANRVTVDLRQANQLELIHGPFEQAAHTAEVRHIDNRRGKYNIPNIGIFLWRLQNYYVPRSTARAVNDPPDGRYTFTPLGSSLSLFNRPRTETTITQLAAEENVPGRLRRRPLYDELETYRQALVDDQTPRLVYFGRQPVLQLFVQESSDSSIEEVPANEILICNLSDPSPAEPPPTDWRRPPASKIYYRTSDGVAVNQPIQVAVDPVTGRLVFPDGVIPNKVQVSYAYGFSGDLGGGPYNRQASVAQWLDPLQIVTWQRGVTQDRATLTAVPDPEQVMVSLGAAIEAWNVYVTDYLAIKEVDDPNPFGLIAIMDSDSYHNLPAADLPRIQIPANSRLAIVAADWPEVEGSDRLGPKERVPGQIVPDERRPHLLGNLSIVGTADSDSIAPGELVLDGLLIEGSVTVAAGNLGRLQIGHCTLVSDKRGVAVEADNIQLAISLERSICGPISLTDSVPKLSVADSIIDSANGVAIQAPGAAVDLQTSTVLGSTTAIQLEASNSIFTRRVQVTRRQLGCVRFCYLPLDSLAPRRYHCQPADADAAGRVVPQFTSVTHGQPAYGQLSLACPTEISRGAEDEGEMGAFHFLQQTHRIKNLQANLVEYLRFGLEAGIFLVT